MKAIFITRKWPPSVGGMETYSASLVACLRKITDLRVIHPKETTRRSAALMQTVAECLLTGPARIRSHDVIHLGDMVLMPLAAIFRTMNRKVRICVTVHGLDIIYAERRTPAGLAYRAYLYLIRKFSPADHYIAVSRHTAEIARKHGFGPVTVIPLAAGEQAIEREGPPDPFILLLGRVVPRKGALWFAGSVLPLLPPNITLVVAGPKEDAGLCRLLEALPRVVVTGAVSREDLNLLKSRAALAVLPNIPSSRQGDTEGFGLVAAELSGAGIPVVASDIEGLPDAVTDQKSGFLCPARDAEAWRDKITEILSWPPARRSAFEQRAKSFTRRHYNWDRVGAETLSVYHSLTSPTGT